MKIFKKININRKNKRVLFTILFSLLLLFVFCVIFLSEQNIYIPRSDDYVIKWKDRELERMVRIGLDSPNGNITQGDVNQITSLVIWGDSLVAVNDSRFSGKYYQFRNYSPYRLNIDNDWGDGRIRSLDDLIYFRNLSSLWVIDNRSLSDIGVLSELPMLSEIHMSMLQFRKKGFLTTLSKWIGLDIGGTGIYHTQEFSKLHNLKVLDVSVSRNLDIQTMSELTQLEGLSLWGNDIFVFDALSDLTNLKILNLSWNNTKSFNALSELTNLTYLDVGYNWVYDDSNDFSFLSHSTNLEYLYLDRSSLPDLTWLSTLPQLKALYLRSCYDIEDISPIYQLGQLQNLNIERTNLSDEEKEKVYSWFFQNKEKLESKQ